jgi:trans-aconitate methyltransferase
MTQRVQNLPPAETYRREAEYMPWGTMIRVVLDQAITGIPHDGTVVDMMCGTGDLLGLLKKERPDVKATGVDLEGTYIEAARKHYPGIEFVQADVFGWPCTKRFDAVLCTGGLHHVPWGDQPALIEKFRALIALNGFAIVGDPYIGPYDTEEERRENAAHLGYQYLLATMRKGAPDDVVKATADLIANDVLGVEFKTCLRRIEPFFEKHFASALRCKTWPKEPGSYGDFYYLCRP